MPDPAPEPIRAVELTSDGSCLVLLHPASLELRHLESGLRIVIHDLAGNENGLSISSDGRRVSLHGTSTLRIWETASGTLIREWPSTDSACTRMMPDGRRILHRDLNGGGVLQLIDVDSGEVKSTLADSEMVADVSVSPSGLYIRATRISDQIAVWNTASGKLVPYSEWITATREPWAGGASAYAITPDRRRTAGGFSDGKLAVSDVGSAQSAGVRWLDGHSAAITAVAISRDGRNVVSAAADGAVRLCDVDSPRSSTTILQAGSPVRKCVIRPDGRTVVAVDEQGRPHVLRNALKAPPRFKVFVDDNYRPWNESRRYPIGEYETCEAATAACRKAIDEFFAGQNLKVDAETLLQTYQEFGQSASIVCDDPNCSFAASDYAAQRAREVAEGYPPPPKPDPRMKYALTTPRRPKTRISVDLESVSTAERRFLPFVVGVIAELADQSSKLRDRQFVSIDIDNFDHVLADMAPNLRIRVRNTLGKGPSEWDLELKFRRLEDFEPQNVVAQVEPLRKLLESRPVSVVDSSRTASTDRELSAQLDAILHHPDFQRLEASWRGLYYLVNNTETSPELKIKVLNASKQDLHREFAKAVSFDRTFLFKKLHDDVYGVRSAEPFGVLIGAYEFASEKEDIEILEGMGRIAAATHAPFIAAAAPRLFGADVFAALKSQPGITSPAFNRFRKSDEARFVALTLPRALMRVAYGNAHPVETFNYQEDAAAAENRLWGNMAFVYGVILTSAYSRHGWLGNITGTEGGGLCQTLPLALSPADDSDEPVSCSTDLAIHEEKRWSDLGFLAARHWPGAEYSSFQSNRSIADPNVPLRFTFAACRFAQQIKVIARDKPGGYGSREECERALNLWIRLYVLKLDPDRAESYPRAAKPLLDGSVSVTQDQSGLCRAEVRIQPLYQIAEAPVVSAVAALPSGIIAGAV